MAPKNGKKMRYMLEAFPEVEIYVNASSVRPALTHTEYQASSVAAYNVSISKVAQIMMQRFLAQYRDRGADAFNEFMAEAKARPQDTFAYLELTGFPAVLEIEKRFLPADQLSKYEHSLGEYDPRA